MLVIYSGKEYSVDFNDGRLIFTYELAKLMEEVHVSAGKVAAQECFKYNLLDVDDMAGDFMLKFMESLPKFKGKSSLNTYLYRVWLNHAKRVLRAQRKQHA